MLWYFIVLVVTLAAGYVVIVLFSNTNSTSTSIDDYIDDQDDDDAVEQLPNSCSKYCTNYTTPGKQVLVLYGTEYGFAEEISRKVFDRLAAIGQLIQPRLINAKNYSMVDFEKEQIMLCVCSTTGDGVPPSDARELMKFLSSEPSHGSSVPSLSYLHYSVLALGDSNYPHYCRTGRQLDSLLSSAGGQCIVQRVDIDQEDWITIDGWIDNVTQIIPTLDLRIDQDYLDTSTQGLESEGIYTRQTPLMATLMNKRLLTVMDDNTDKETIHCEFDCTSLQYTSGDALGIYPLNDPLEVEEVMRLLHVSVDGKEVESVPVPSGRPLIYHEPNMTLYDALLYFYDLKSIRVDLFKAITSTLSDSDEKHEAETILANGVSKANVVLSKYLTDHEVVDVLREFPSHSCAPKLFISLLKPLQPRYYSIASSPTQGLAHVSVCAAVIRYQLHGTPRTGVCTTFLQDRLAIGGQVPVFISSNPDFRLPSDNSIPIIMIGPGTGLSPFRAFIQERGSNSGTNLLYFGCRHRNKDYLYKDELEEWSRDGTITLRVAFSRDQQHKIYVQDLIKQDASNICDIIENGGHIYVCGDAQHMAPDVHKAIIHCMTTIRQCTLEEAETYMTGMEEQGRYQRDVWVT